jgi:nitric oxide reductase subunit C
MDWLGVSIGSLFLVLVLTLIASRGRSWLDPKFWRNAAVVSTLAMSAVLLYLTFDSLSQIAVGGPRVPPFTVINQQIGYAYDAERRYYVPNIGETVSFFGRLWSEEDAKALVDLGKATVQSRNCMDCHTLLGNGAYYAPDLTKAWLDPKWEAIQPVVEAESRETAMQRWLMRPNEFPTWERRMPNLNLSEEEAQAVVAFLKFMAAIDTNGFPDHFGVSAAP